jgi:hypothetical protein
MDSNRSVTKAESKDLKKGARKYDSTMQGWINEETDEIECVNKNCGSTTCKVVVKEGEYLFVCAGCEKPLCGLSR